MSVEIRQARSADHDWVVSVVDVWWGRPVASEIPRMFLDPFHNTSLVAEIENEASTAITDLERLTCSSGETCSSG